ncbi:MAG TPA: AI-2E family transporter, partial [Patescibacteria group bacterium]|nr:AI-2E family transporter [Patescibacteria group bacterium]
LVYGKAVNLHPAIVLMAIPAGAALAGVVGMFLAVPFIGVIAATWRTVLRLFGERPGDVATQPGPVVAPSPSPTADTPSPP